jgi:AGZA family xanthine/uracil permease-like MFS transporter
MQAEPRESSLASEVIGGVTTFLAMAYIVVVNPSILSTSGTGMSFSGVLTATVLLCFVMTLLMGLYARLPFGVAPGMGLNAYFSFTIILGQGVPWQVALGIVFWAGVLFFFMSATPLRPLIARAIPGSLRTSMAAGIGVFLTFIGFRNAGLVTFDPVTLVKPGELDHRALLTIVGIGITIWLQKRKSSFAFLAGIGAVTAIAWATGLVPAPSSWLSPPDFESVFLKLDVLGALELALLPAIVGIFFTDLFDSISTFMGVSLAAGMLDAEGNPRRLKEGLIVDSFATLGAGLFGTSSGTAYIESAAGVNAGARTGLAAVVTALCFLPCFFVAPLAGAVPPYATAPVLILVGAMMFRTVGAIDFTRIEESLPAFLTVALIPLTFSITQGILWGFVAHVSLYMMMGRRREVPVTMYVLAVVAIGLLLLEHGKWQ